MNGDHSDVTGPPHPLRRALLAALLGVGLGAVVGALQSSAGAESTTGD